MRKKELGCTHIMSTPPVKTGRGDLCGTLTVLSGSATGTLISLTNVEIIIGRSPDVGVQLNDDGVSRRHARVLPWQSGYLLEDLGSTNGTYINGERIETAVPLVDGTRIQIGTTVLQYDLQDLLQQEASRRMYEMAVRDGLTGLYNRRHFDERLSAEFAFSKRHGTDLGVILVDVDHFKRVNDRFGHQTGDAVLQQVGRILQSSVRTEDIVTRYGGEEFAVIVRGIPTQGVRALGERLRATLAELMIASPEGPLHITASFGIAHTSYVSTVVDKLVETADAALYEAKRLGRNRVAGPAAPGRHTSPDQRSAARRQTTTRQVRREPQR